MKKVAEEEEIRTIQARCPTEDTRPRSAGHGSGKPGKTRRDCSCVLQTWGEQRRAMTSFPRAHRAPATLFPSRWTAAEFLHPVSCFHMRVHLLVHLRTHIVKHTPK